MHGLETIKRMNADVETGKRPASNSVVLFRDYASTIAGTAADCRAYPTAGIMLRVARQMPHTIIDHSLCGYVIDLLDHAWLMSDEDDLKVSIKRFTEAVKAFFAEEGWINV